MVSGPDISGDFRLFPASADFEEACGVDESTQVSQDLYLTYAGLPVDPADGRRMSTVRAAALAGVTDRTVRNWRADSSFAARERMVRRQGVAQAKQTAQAAVGVLLPQAVHTLAECLADEAVSASVRARIAMKVLDWCGAGESEAHPGLDPWGDLLRQLVEVGVDAEDDVA